ncbi:MAG: glycosyltransferase family 39 protein [Candidatus Micrarchaeaceae archaeon]
MIIGYVFTAAFIVLFAALVASAFLSRKRILKALSGKISPFSVAIALVVMAFFVLFSVFFIHPVEQLYFDENIYQGIALNILHNGNALWCQYGTSLLSSCPLSELYHDPVEISFFIAMAFGLFGVGMQTAYALELAIGALAIFFVFLLSSSLFGKKTGVASTIVFALIPELFIWSRTQAIPDLYFTTFSVLAFFAYSVYRRQRSHSTLAFLLSALGIAVYMRIEGIILLPIFMALAFYDSAASHGIKKGINKLANPQDSVKVALIVLFTIIMIPEVVYIMHEYQNPSYGATALCNSTSAADFSLSNLACNISPNVKFFLGAFNSISYYPAYFSAITTAIAIIGLALLLFGVKKKGYTALFMLVLWIAAFYLFYSAFYAGSVLFGVDVRFMLIIYPAIAILAGVGISKLSALASDPRRPGKGKALSFAVYAALILAFAIYPFYNSMNIITMNTSQMPQQQMALNAVNFIYQNAGKVPSNCLVFTFTPDVWYELNRSAAQVGYFGSLDPNFTRFASQFSCFVFDQGYWCTTGQYKNSVCAADLGRYGSTAIATAPAMDQADNISLYYINGYK